MYKIAKPVNLFRLLPQTFTTKNPHRHQHHYTKWTEHTFISKCTWPWSEEKIKKSFFAKEPQQSGCLYNKSQYSKIVKYYFQVICWQQFSLSCSSNVSFSGCGSKWAKLQPDSPCNFRMISVPRQQAKKVNLKDILNEFATNKVWCVTSWLITASTHETKNQGLNNTVRVFIML